MQQSPVEIQQNVRRKRFPSYTSIALTPSRHIIFLVIVYYFYIHGKINNVRSKSMERETNEEKMMFNYLDTAQCSITGRLYRALSHGFDRLSQILINPNFSSPFLAQTFSFYDFVFFPFSLRKCFGIFWGTFSLLSSRHEIISDYNWTYCNKHLENKNFITGKELKRADYRWKNPFFWFTFESNRKT